MKEETNILHLRFKMKLLLVDETTDISTKEQMALCLRYVDDSFCIHESFLKFIAVNSLTGCNLDESIINGQ